MAACFQSEPLTDRAIKTRVSRVASYPSGESWNLLKEIRDLKLTGTLTIHFHAGRENESTWTVVEVGR